jgi:hypothetical protein
MEIKLEKVVSVLTVFAAWAYMLGYLKRYYYFQTFGIGLSSLHLSPQDYLFESWYPLENVFFFALLLWIAAVVRRFWVRIIAAMYFPLPYLGQWAYNHYDWRAAYALAHLSQSILKFTPFVVLLMVIVFHREESRRLLSLSWPYGKFYFVLFVVAVFAWSVSAAKHIGGADAAKLLVCPEDSLSRVKLHVSTTAPEQLKNLERNQNLYILYASQYRYFVLDGTDFPCVRDRREIDLSDNELKLYDIPRDRIDWIDDFKKPDTEPGALILY